MRDTDNKELEQALTQNQTLTGRNVVSAGSSCRALEGRLGLSPDAEATGLWGHTTVGPQAQRTMPVALPPFTV